LTSWEGTLFNPDPGAYLPHRPPFLFLDRITRLEPGVSATALQRVTSDAPQGSQFYFVEAIAQLGGIAAGREEGGGGILAAIDRAEFHGSAVAGDELIISVRIVKSFAQLHLVEGEVSKAGDTVATAAVVLKVGIMP
jgi:3-hydroxyacyl-[acyl-carrier-protein] dehydratase